MFIELVDTLRCPNPHEESWLVASADRMEARHIVSGMLGCPVCGAEYPIERGVVDFRTRAQEPASHAEVPDTEPMALAALLGLADSQGYAVLEGNWGALADGLASVVETPLILVDPPERVVGAPGISVLRCDGELPLASSAARAVAVDTRMDSCLRVVRPQGRVVAPVSLEAPASVKLLARDERLWVGEREAPASPLVALHVRRS